MCELNYRVRDGNGWTLTVIGTDFVVASSVRLAFLFGKLICTTLLLLFLTNFVCSDW